MTDTPTITRSSWISVLALGLVWGASFLFIELALAGIGPFWLAASRILLAGAVTTAVWRARGCTFYTSPARAPLPLLLAVGAMSSALPFMAISWGQQVVTSGFAGVSMAAVALMVLPLAHVFVPGERMTLRRTIGFLTGFVGVVVLIGPEALASTGREGEVWGQLACLAAAACYAVSSILMRRIPPVDPLGLSAVTLWIGGAIVTMAALMTEGLPPLPGREVVAVLVTLGLVQTAAANLLRIVVIRSAGPTFMSLTNYMVPLWSVILGVLILNEPTEPTLFVAMALILAGVLLSQWGALKRTFGRG